MKKLLLIILIILFSLTSYAQDGRARSKSGSLYPKQNKTELKTEDDFIYQVPFLTAEVVFSEPSGNNLLDAKEKAILTVNIANIGQRTAQDCKLRFIPKNQQENIETEYDESIGNILPSQSKQLTVDITSNQDLKSGSEKFKLEIIEKNGFDLDPPKSITIYTREFQPPKNVIVDYGIDDQTRDLIIDKSEIVDVTFRIQNQGETPSFGTTASIELGDNVLALDKKEIYQLGNLEPGDYKDVKVKIVTNNRAKEVKLKVQVKEETGKYSVSNNYDLPFNVKQKRTDEIVIAKNDESDFYIPNVAGLKLDIAENIPIATQIKQHAVAVIIGNKNYKSPDVPAVDFAINDAALVKNYVISAMGYKPDNIIYIENATQADFIRTFGSETNYQGRLFDYVTKGFSEVFVYYSGHGAPDPNTNNAFIVPTNCDPNNVSLNGYGVNTLYKNLDRIAEEKELKHVTVVMDACFSGNSAAGSLMKNISPIYMKFNNSKMNYKNSTIISSSAQDQVSNWYRDKKQGLFTYFFLKGLQGSADFDSDGIVTAKEVFNFTNDEINGVPHFARRLYSRNQTPVFSGNDINLVKSN